MNNQIFSLGVKGGEIARSAGTMVLHASPAAPVVTVPFSTLLNAVAEHCTFVGSAVAAG